MQRKRKKVEVGTDFLFLDSKITAWWLQPWNQETIASWQESDDEFKTVLKTRDITLPTEVCIVKTTVFPVVMFGCDSWIRKRQSTKELMPSKNWYWRRLLKVPWTVRRVNRTVLMEINPEFSLEGLMLKLKLWYVGQLMQTSDSLEKSLMLGKIEVRKRRGHQRTRCLDDITDAMNMNLGKLQEMVWVREGYHAAIHGVTNSQTWLADWPTTTVVYVYNTCVNAFWS